MKRKKAEFTFFDDCFRLCACLLLLLLATGGVHGNPNGCSFPEFLQTEGEYSTWLFNLTRAGIITDNTQIHYIRVDGGLMKTYVLEREGGQFNRTCLEAKGNNTYVVYEVKENNKQSTLFLCMKFIQRSKTVVQMEVSEYANTPRQDLCDRLELEERPIVRSSRDAAQICPLAGGFNMEVFRSSGEPLCHHMYTTARLESNCMGDEFLQFNFQECHMENVIVDMEKLQNLDCTGSWQSGQNTFVILSRRDLLGFWCLRFLTNHGDEFDAYLFSDVVCERSDDLRKSAMYARLHLKRKVYNSICSDASEDCDSKDVASTCGISSQYGKTYCKQKCTTCANEDGVHCEFKPEILGTWMPIGVQPLNNITLGSTASLMPLDNMPCKDQRKYFDEYKLISYSSNGCYPRFYCFSAKSVSPNVMVYKMLRGPKWPMYELDYIPCSDDKYDRGNRYFKYFVNEWSPAISQNPPVPIACELPEVSYMIEAIFADGVKCSGRLFKPDCREDEAETMTLHYTQCTNATYEKSSNLICHAHIPSDNERYLLISDENTGAFYCLLFSYYSMYTSELSILPPDKCNSDGYFFHRIVKMTLELETPNHCVSEVENPENENGEISSENSNENVENIENSKEIGENIENSHNENHENIDNSQHSKEESDHVGVSTQYGLSINRQNNTYKIPTTIKPTKDDKGSNKVSKTNDSTSLKSQTFFLVVCLINLIKYIS